VISVGHRSELEEFHDRKINLVRREGGARLISDGVEAPPISVMNTLLKRWRGPTVQASIVTKPPAR